MKLPAASNGVFNPRTRLNLIILLTVLCKKLITEVLVEELNAIKKELHKKFPNNKEAYQTGKKHFYDKIHRMI